MAEEGYTEVAPAQELDEQKQQILEYVLKNAPFGETVEIITGKEGIIDRWGWFAYKIVYLTQEFDSFSQFMCCCC